jgi:galactose mutarotase-like enzyme
MPRILHLRAFDTTKRCCAVSLRVANNVVDGRIDFSSREVQLSISIIDRYRKSLRR